MVLRSERSLKSKMLSLARTSKYVNDTNVFSINNQRRTGRTERVDAEMSTPKTSTPKISTPKKPTVPKCLLPKRLLCENIYSQNVYSQGQVQRASLDKKYIISRVHLVNI